MPRLARRSIHRSLEELIAWIEHLQDNPKPSSRELLVFGAEVFPRFIALLPDLIQALNEAGTEPSEASESLRFNGIWMHEPPPQPPAPSGQNISARVRRRPEASDDEDRERQCIGPVVGERGGCVGRGAATGGWQPESPENFSRKRNHFQARCKICDSHRSQGRQIKLTRRSSAARHWLALSELIAKDGVARQLSELQRLSLSVLEELRDDWWAALQTQAQRIIALGGLSFGEAWLAVDVDRQRVYSGSTPTRALAAAGPGPGPEDDDRLFVVIPKSTS